MASKSWSGASGGLWATDGNWSPAGAATALDDAGITGPGSGTLVVNGPGTAARLTLVGNTTLGGAVRTGVLTVGTASVAGALVLGGGASVTAGSASVMYGPVQVSGAGTTLSVAGALTLGGVVSSFRTDSLTVAAGASVLVGSLALAASALVQSQVSVDSESRLEVGGVGLGAAGAITVDAGGSLVGAGTLTTAAGVANQGTILAQGGTLTVIGGIAGTGALQIGAGAGLALYGGATTEGVTFTGAGGSLQVTTVFTFANGVFTFGLSDQGTISGFGPGDALIYSGNSTLAGVNFAPGDGGVGTLTLLSGAASAGSLMLLGSYVGEHFVLGPRTAQGYSIGVAAWASPDPLFDVAYYLAKNPDVAAAGVDPFQHYSTTGWKEGRNPSALFDTAYYLAHNADVAAAGVNPLLHFENSGWKEGRNPSVLFDTAYYLAQNPDVRAAGIDPLAHFGANGWAEGRQPTLLFDDAKYLAAYPDIKAAGIDPLVHFIANGQAEGRTAFLTGGTAAADPLVNATYYDRQLGATLVPAGVAGAQQAAWSYDVSGWQKGLNPNAYFNTSYYLSHNPDVAAAHVDPLLHYETSGWREGRDPSAQFSTNKYLAAYGDVKAAGIDPLLHYVSYGQTEGRLAYVV